MRCADTIAKMRVDVSEQGEERVVLLPRRRDLIGGQQRLGIIAFSEIGVGHIEFHVIQIGIRVQGRLEMLDSFIV